VDNSGGGVYIAYRGSSVMEGGSVYGNTAKLNGGGIYVAGNGSYSMEGGVVNGRDAEEGSKNTAEKGAAVYDDNQSSNFKPLDNTVR
jgi:predicted outer membrane repeat protein